MVEKVLDDKHFRGVRKRQGGRYAAKIRDPRKKSRDWLGIYDTAEEAARAYNIAARSLHGPKAKTNFPLPQENDPTIVDSNQSPGRSSALPFKRSTITDCPKLQINLPPCVFNQDEKCKSESEEHSMEVTSSQEVDAPSTPSALKKKAVELNRGSWKPSGESEDESFGDGKLKFAFFTKSDFDIMDDGYPWRKYAQKTMLNSPYPRSYYKCSFQGCPMKKRVVRCSDDPIFVQTTYAGFHDDPSFVETTYAGFHNHPPTSALHN